jgi:ATP-dependent phosphofructokinase / diphosphate-dependent phosphofructokinase
MNIGVLTGGGDCPGLNAAIRAIVKYGSKRYTDRFVGIKYGWKGLINKSMPIEERVTELTPVTVSGILTKGGTILYSSRTNPLSQENGLEELRLSFDELGLDALIAIGGEDTLGVAHAAFAKFTLPIVGVPKTIDNDLRGTDTTIGFTTAYTVVTEAVDRLHSTAESHDMIHIIEVMGRNTGWIALRGGMAGGADIILIPEHPLSIEEICSLIEERRCQDKRFSIIVVAEGYPLEGEIIKSDQKDAFGHEQLGGVGDRLAAILKAKTGFEVRVTNPAYMQRGGIPAAYDRFIAIELGERAVDLVHNKRFGRMTAIARNQVTDVELSEVTGTRKVPLELFEKMRWLFG